MNTLPVDWKPMATFTPKELADLTRQYIASHYPDWDKKRYSVSVRWTRGRQYGWIFNFKQDENDKQLIEELGFYNDSFGWRMEQHIRTLLNARVVSIAYDRQAVVVEALTPQNPFQFVHIPTTL